MKNLRQLLVGSGAALLSLALVLGSFSMSFTESGVMQALLQTMATQMQITATRFLVVTVTPPLLFSPTLSSEATRFPTEVPTLTATWTSTSTLPPVAGECPPPPPGWSRIVVQVGDTLDSLAQAYGTTVDILRQVNCLVLDTLPPGTTLYVPGRPTPTVIACGPPKGWVFYVVQPGDTLSQLSRLFGVSVYELQLANCMVGQTLIRWGTKLYVPNVPISTRTPTYTATSTASLTAEPTWTATPVLLPTHTITPVWTNTASPTSPPEPTYTATLTPLPSPSMTATPAFTEFPTFTPTWAPTATQPITGTIP